MGVIEKITTHSEPYLYNFWTSEIIQHKRNIQISFIQLGRALYNIYAKKLYKVAYQSFQEYIDSAHIEIKYATAMQLIRVYQKYIVELKVSEEIIMGVDYVKLDIIRPIVKKDNYDKVISMANDLPRQVLRKKLKKGENLTRKTSSVPKKKKRGITIRVANDTIILMLANNKKYNVTYEFIAAVKLRMHVQRTNKLKFGKIVLSQENEPEKERLEGIDDFH